MNLALNPKYENCPERNEAKVTCSFNYTLFINSLSIGYRTIKIQSHFIKCSLFFFNTLLKIVKRELQEKL